MTTRGAVEPDTHAPEGEDVDDVDHFTCCDAAYFLATDRPIHAVCGRRMRPDDDIKLETDGTPICEHCLWLARSVPSEEAFCARLCPRMVFG